jgi:hypothetical protein
MTEQVQYSYDEIVAKYLEIRDAKKVLEDKHKAEIAEYDRRLTVIEGYLLNQLNESGVESMRTKAGTCYKHVQTSVKVADKDVFRTFVETSGDLSLMTVSANKTRVLEVLEETGELVPGLNMTRVTTVGIRKGKSIGD